MKPRFQNSHSVPSITVCYSKQITRATKLQEVGKQVSPVNQRSYIQSMTIFHLPQHCKTISSNFAASFESQRWCLRIYNMVQIYRQRVTNLVNIKINIKAHCDGLCVLQSSFSCNLCFLILPEKKVKYEQNSRSSQLEGKNQNYSVNILQI